MQVQGDTSIAAPNHSKWRRKTTHRPVCHGTTSENKSQVRRATLQPGRAYWRNNPCLAFDAPSDIYEHGACNRHPNGPKYTIKHLSTNARRHQQSRQRPPTTHSVSVGPQTTSGQGVGIERQILNKPAPREIRSDGEDQQPFIVPQRDTIL